MEKIIIKFDDIKIAKQKYHQDKRPISIKNVNIDKIIVCNKVLLVKKDLNILLAMKMPEKLDLYMYFSPKCMHIEKPLMKLNSYLFLRIDNELLEKDNELLEKYNEIWGKISYASGKEFDANSVYNKKYLKAKIKSYDQKVNRNFHGNKLPRESSEFICLSVILIDSVFKSDNNYYP